MHYVHYYTLLCAIEKLYRQRQILNVEIENLNKLTTLGTYYWIMKEGKKEQEEDNRRKRVVKRLVTNYNNCKL